MIIRRTNNGSVLRGISDIEFLEDGTTKVRRNPVSLLKKASKGFGLFSKTASRTGNNIFRKASELNGKKT